MHPFPRHRPAALTGRGFVPLGLLLPAAALAAENRDPAAAPPLVLPRITVVETATPFPFDGWRIHDEHLRVLSNADDAAVQTMLREFRLFQVALDVVWPGANPDPEQRPTLLLCRDHADFVRFLPPESRAGASSTRTSLFLSGFGRSYIVIDLSRHGKLMSADEFAYSHPDSAYVDQENLSTSTPTIDAQVHLHTHYVRHLTRTNALPSLRWFGEGLTQLFATMRVERDRIVFARIETPPVRNRLSGSAKVSMGRAPPEFITHLAEFEAAMQELEGPARADFNTILAQRKLIPWDVFFSAARSPVEGPLQRLWATQAKALVHLCLYGKDQRHQAGFLRLVNRATHEEVSEELLRASLGLGYAELTRELTDYIDTTAYRHFTFTSKSGPLPRPPPLALRPASEAEIAAFPGLALALAGNIAAARAAAPRSSPSTGDAPALLGTLGLIERAAGDPDRAIALLERAIAAGTEDPHVPLELARLHLRAARTPAAKEIEVAQAARVLQPLIIAVTKRHCPKEAYHLIVDTWLLCPLPPARSNFEVMEQGVSRFPHDFPLAEKLVALYARSGHRAQALALIATQRAAASPALHGKFDALKASLQRKP